MDSVLKKQGELTEQVNKELKIEIDEQNIGGGYNTMSLVVISLYWMGGVVKLIDWLGNKGGIGGNRHEIL